MSIDVRQVSKRFGTFHALDNVSLAIPDGELVALLGPSGSGKTTLLRLIAGLDTPDSGNILVNGQTVENQPVRERGVGFVFQHYALFRHMTVFENVAFGLRVRPRKQRFSDTEISKRVHALLNLVQLDWIADRYPNQLSGGQRQRVALARALAIEPKLLLLDEPFGALDAKVRKELRRWLRRLHQEMSVTTIFVTHDQDEALEVADRIVIVNKGRIEQYGSPQEVYDHPANPFVFDFLGTANRFHGRISSGTAALAGFGNVQHAGPQAEGAAVGYARPHELALCRDPGEATVGAKVEDVQFGGSLVRIELTRLDDNSLLFAELSREEYRVLAAQPGEELFVSLKNVKVFTEDYSI